MHCRASCLGLPTTACALRQTFALIAQILRPSTDAWGTKLAGEGAEQTGRGQGGGQSQVVFKTHDPP